MSLPWDRFEALPGAPDRNLELLWRGIVQRTWERFGRLRSVRQQPGVEFHLLLESECDLGEAGRWFGWQCRWYTLKADNGFRASQIEGIKESIRKTVKYLPGLTDYVLCLRQRPAAQDVDWYLGLTAADLELERIPRLHLWDEEDLEPRLSGPAEVLRATYFGELVITPAELETARNRALAPVKDRWMPEVNVATQVQDDVEGALLRAGSLEELAGRSRFLKRLSSDSASEAGLPDGTADDMAELRRGLATLALTLDELVSAVDAQDPAGAVEFLNIDMRPAIGPAAIRRLARRLRAAHHPAALPASAAEGAIRKVLSLVDHHRTLAAAPLLAVVGDPGRGKSHLSAQVTVSDDAKVAGVFMPGRDLEHGSSLDELAARVPGLPPTSIDELLEALDAAGARAGQRIALVVDGLNEAERPHEWRDELAKVEPVLGRYPNVLLIVTLRGVVADDVLIPEAHVVPLRWREHEEDEAIARYFEYYKINPGSARLHLWLLRDPLFLRLFCEAVNAERELWVGAEAIPDDLVAVYELFRDRTARRLATKLGLREQLVARKLAAVARALWERRARDLPFEEVQEIVDERETEWQNSLVREFEQEGIFSRNPEESWQDQRTAVLFDRFAGYLIAESLLRDRNRAEAEELIGSQGLWTAMTGDDRRRHPLGGDILNALVGLVPRAIYGRQLWQFAPEGLRDRTLALTLGIASSLIDQETESELARYISERSPSPNSFNEHPFDQLWDVHDAPGHRLNALFLDRVLRLMPMAHRDARWTEWLRHRERVPRSLDDATRWWSAHAQRGSASDLAARALAWVLTTTNRRLRDSATRALQRYGAADPDKIFSLALESLDVDDPYVMERLLAASVGAALEHQMPDPGGGFTGALRAFLVGLGEHFLEPDPRSATSHVLIRDHVRTLVEFAAALHPHAFPADLNQTALEFGSGPVPPALASDSDEGQEVERTLHMDFENYTVGSLFEDRGNYQFEHAGYQAGLAEVRGRVWELGWRASLFREIDDRIAEDGWRRGRTDNADRTERYGKKYGWIGYYELAGRMSDRGEIRARDWLRSEVPHELDPTFPADPPPLSLTLPKWASQPPEDDREWYETGAVEVPDELLRPAELDGDAGPWLLVDGFLMHRDRERGREVWGFFRSMLAAAAEGDDLRAILERKPYLGNHFVPEPPMDSQTYAGEMPWSDRFLERGELGYGDPPYVIRVGRYDGGREFEVELVAHDYSPEVGALESAARGCSVPSARLARAGDLRASPGRIELVGLDGSRASRTFVAPEGFSGNFLFIREDLVARYADGRALVQVGWGERRILSDWQSRPEWLAQTAEHADLWRRIELRRW